MNPCSLKDRWISVGTPRLSQATMAGFHSKIHDTTIIIIIVVIIDNFYSQCSNPIDLNFKSILKFPLINRPNQLTQCCTQFKSPGVKILCILQKNTL